MARDASNPLLRVTRASIDPLDPTSSRVSGGRWNGPGEFAVLYTATAELVLKALVGERLRRAGVEIADLTDDTRPTVTGISWQGDGVDVVSANGLTAIGLPTDYPRGFEANHAKTQALGREWHAAGEQAVVCRSASLARWGFVDWVGAHEDWSEVAIIVDRASHPPELVSRETVDDDWLALSLRPDPPAI